MSEQETTSFTPIITEVQREWYSKVQCKANKNKLYVFGDNLLRTGCGGQAIIRYETNTHGIATKSFPGTHPTDYFDDSPHQAIAVINDIHSLITKYHTGEYDCVVLPHDGLGTGLSKMDKTSPQLFKMMNSMLQAICNIETYPPHTNYQPIEQWGNFT